MCWSKVSLQVIFQFRFHFSPRFFAKLRTLKLSLPHSPSTRSSKHYTTAIISSSLRSKQSQLLNYKLIVQERFSYTIGKMATTIVCFWRCYLFLYLSCSQTGLTSLLFAKFLVMIKSPLLQGLELESNIDFISFSARS